MEPPARDEWGPVLWRLIHLQAISYPDAPTEDDKQAARTYFAALSKFLPCPECMGHFQTLLSELPIEPHLGSCKQLTDWTHELHNRVNQRLGKTEITRQEFYKLYANATQRMAHNARFAAQGELTADKPVSPLAHAAPVSPLARAVPIRPPPTQHAAMRAVRPVAGRAAPAPQARAAPAPAQAKPAPSARNVPAPRSAMGRRTIKIGPRKPVGFKATGCPTCR